MNQIPREQLDKIVIGGLDSFDFSLCERNQALMRQMTEEGHSGELKNILKTTSSGTTIVGSVFEVIFSSFFFHIHSLFIVYFKGRRCDGRRFAIHYGTYHR